MSLKPCPFCGKPPEIGPSDPSRDGDAWGYVRCVNQRCPTFDERRGHGVQVMDGELVCDTRGTAEYIRLAVTRWNDRVAP